MRTAKRRVIAALALAALMPCVTDWDALGVHSLNDGGSGSGGSSGDGGKSDGKADDEKSKSGEKKDDAGDSGKKESKDDENVTISKAALKAQTEKAIADALAKREKDAEEQAKKADREKKKKEGDVQGLLEAEKEANAELKREAEALKFSLKREQVHSALRDHLIENNEAYVKCANYILPLIEFDADTDDDAIQTSIKSAVAQYVKDNPRSGGEGGSGAPGAGARGKKSGDNDKKPPAEKKDDSGKTIDAKRVNHGRYLAAM